MTRRDRHRRRQRRLFFSGASVAVLCVGFFGGFFVIRHFIPVRTARAESGSGSERAEGPVGVMVRKAMNPNNREGILVSSTEQAKDSPAKSNTTNQLDSTVQVYDQFTGSALDTSLWEAMSLPRGYRNNEEQSYDPSQVRVANGMLTITAERDSQAQWHSGEVNSKWHYTYGEFEVRMALSRTGPGVWPAAWLLGDHGQWPNNGEIDMVESVNSDPMAYGTIHGGGTSGPWLSQKYVWGINQTQFHTYKITKKPNYISWSIDGVERMSWSPGQLQSGQAWPFEGTTNTGILNLAIGGDWPGRSDASTPSPITLTIDYFKVTNAS